MKVVFLLQIFFLMTGCLFSKNLSKKESFQTTPLKILESYTIPLPEVSGLAWRTHPQSDNKELVAVGDHDFAIVFIDWNKRKTKFEAKKIDLKKLFNPKPGEQSEWEAVHCDKSGRIFIIKEQPAKIIIISSNFSKIEGEYDLSTTSLLKSKKSDFNSGIEGFILLNNGHFLGVKEKKPLRLFEFSPPGEKASGFQASNLMKPQDLFPTKPNTDLRYEASQMWSFDKKTEKFLEDSSELITDKHGELYLLGDQKKLIVRLGNEIIPDQKSLKILNLWSLPSPIIQPEGMVIDDEGRPIIAIDHKNEKKVNLFLLSPLIRDSKGQ